MIVQGENPSALLSTLMGPRISAGFLLEPFVAEVQRD